MLVKGDEVLTKRKNKHVEPQSQGQREMTERKWAWTGGEATLHAPGKILIFSSSTRPWDGPLLLSAGEGVSRAAVSISVRYGTTHLHGSARYWEAGQLAGHWMDSRLAWMVALCCAGLSVRFCGEKKNEM